MRFAEFQPGRVIDAGSFVVTDADVIEFATRYDPQWFHVDPVASAANSKFGGLIASGWQTCCCAMRLVADNVLAGSESFASPGLQYVKWPNPLRPGDVIGVKLEVLESRISESRPTLGIVRWTWLATNQNDAIVLELEATSMFDLGTGR